MKIECTVIWISKRLGLLILSSFLGLLLLCGAYILPEASMLANAQSSAEILSEEGSFPVKWGEPIGSTLDNFTDALMIQNAVCPSSGSILKDAVSVDHMIYDGTFQPIDNLSREFFSDKDGHRQEYMRYWHGYLIFLKPLLLVTDYTGIRFINMVLQIILLFFLLFFMFRRGLRRYIPAFLVSWLAIAPWVLPLSMQLSTIYYIAMLGNIFLLAFYPYCSRHIGIYFMLLGILTSYFDYFTYPLVSLGLPLIFYLLKESEKSNKQIKPLLLRTLVLCANWGIGYGGMWAAKWIISEAVLHTGAISQALGAILYRTSSESEGAGIAVTALLVWKENIMRIFNPAFYIGAFIYTIGIAALITHNIRHKMSSLHFIASTIFLLPALLPFIWYALIKNHSFVHLPLVYRSLWISVFAGICFITKLFRSPNRK